MSTPPTPDLPAEAAVVTPDRDLAWLRVGLKNRMVLGHTPDVAEFLAEYDAAVRTAAFTEAADALLRVDPVEWALAGQRAGNDAADLLRRLAAAVPATTTTESADA